MIALLASLIAMNSTSACTGTTLAITKVATTSVSSNGLSTYTLKITVTNTGSTGQPGNTLDSVSEVLDGEKKGEKGLPPLAAGASYTFPYVVLRSADAPAGTTEIGLRILPSSAGCQGDLRKVII